MSRERRAEGPARGGRPASGGGRRRAQSERRGVRGRRAAGVPGAPAREAAAREVAAAETTAGRSSVVIGGVTRQELREQERRRGRRRTQITSAAVVVVLLVVAGVVVSSLAGGRHRSSGPAPRTQRVLELAVVDTDGSALEAALVAHDPRRRAGSLLLLPSRTVSEVPGRGSAPLGRAFALGGPQVAAETAADLVGVTVDGALGLTRGGLGLVVDRLGGVDANVDADVLGQPAAGGRPIVVAHGPQHLGGVAATAFATYLADGEPETARLARLQGVLDGIAKAAHSRPGVLAAELGSLGPEAVFWGLDVGAAAALVEGYGGDSDSEDTLSVKQIDTGGAPAYGVDPQGLRQQQQALFSNSLPASSAGQANRVLVQNGVGTPGLGESARAKLVAAGFRYRPGGNVPGFTFRDQPSAVLISDATESSIALGRRVAASLGLPPADVKVSPDGQSVADVVVVLGADYRG